MNIRTEIILKYNFDYDLDMIDIPDDYVGQLDDFISHATIIVI